MSKMKRNREARGAGDIGNIILILVKHGNHLFQNNGNRSLPVSGLTFQAR